MQLTCQCEKLRKCCSVYVSSLKAKDRQCCGPRRWTKFVLGKQIFGQLCTFKGPFFRVISKIGFCQQVEGIRWILGRYFQEQCWLSFGHWLDGLTACWFSHDRAVNVANPIWANFRNSLTIWWPMRILINQVCRTRIGRIKRCQPDERFIHWDARKALSFLSSWSSNIGAELKGVFFCTQLLTNFKRIAAAAAWNRRRRC